MTIDNKKAIQEMYQAFARADIPAVLGAMDPQIEWREADNFIYADGNPYVGPQGVLMGVFARLGAEWEGFKATPDEIFDAGDTIVSRGYYEGRFRKTGRAVRAQFAHIFTMRDGKVAKFQQYTDTAQFKDATAE